MGLLGVCGGERGRRKRQAGLGEKGHLGVFSADTLPKPTAEPPGAGRGLPASVDRGHPRCWRVRLAHPPLVALGGTFIPDFSQFAGQEAPVEGSFLRLPQIAAIVTWRLPGALVWLRGGHPLVRP